MNRRKINISLRLGLAALLAVACLVVSVGVSLARYRDEENGSVQLEARVPGQVYLGKIVYDEETGAETFDASVQGGWEVIDGQTQLEFAVANGISTEAFTQDDQQVYIRLVGSLGIRNGEQIVTVKLLVPKQPVPMEEETGGEEDAAGDEESATEGTSIEIPEIQYDIFDASAVRINPESPMYTTFGDGWVFSFLDAEGKELGWMLEGGKQSCISMKLILEDTELTETSLLQLQVTGRFTDE